MKLLFGKRIYMSIFVLIKIFTMTSDELRFRILRLKERLPNKYAERLKDRFPKYKKIGQIDRVRKVVSLQLLDESIVNDLEKIIL